MYKFTSALTILAKIQTQLAIPTIYKDYKKFFIITQKKSQKIWLFLFGFGVPNRTRTCNFNLGEITG